jgi:hypothetical protein
MQEEEDVFRLRDGASAGGQLQIPLCEFIPRELCPRGLNQSVGWLTISHDELTEMLDAACNVVWSEQMEIEVKMEKTDARASSSFR